MARLPRFFVPDVPLHIIQRGNNRDAIFGRPADFVFLYERLVLAARVHGVSVHAYVLMINHLHLLVTPSLPTSVPKMMQSLGRIYVAYFNGRYGRTGTLWEGRYKAAIVEHESYLLSCMRYIESNPVRARIVESPSEYRWSSFRANACGGVDRLITPHPIYDAMGDSTDARQMAYRDLFGSAVPEDMCPKSETPRRTRGHSQIRLSGARYRFSPAGHIACECARRRKPRLMREWSLTLCARRQPRGSLTLFNASMRCTRRSSALPASHESSYPASAGMRMAWWRCLDAKSFRLLGCADTMPSTTRRWKENGFSSRCSLSLARWRR